MLLKVVPHHDTKRTPVEEIPKCLIIVIGGVNLILCANFHSIVQMIFVSNKGLKAQSLPISISICYVYNRFESKFICRFTHFFPKFMVTNRNKYCFLVAILNF